MKVKISKANRKRNYDVISATDNPYADLQPDAESRIAMYSDCINTTSNKHNRAHIRFESKIGTLQINFYKTIIPIIRTYLALHYPEMEKKYGKKNWKKQAIPFAKQFVNDTWCWLKYFDTIFNDLTQTFIEAIAGNVFILDTSDHTFSDEDLQAWFLIHYRTEDTNKTDAKLQPKSKPIPEYRKVKTGGRK